MVKKMAYVLACSAMMIAHGEQYTNVFQVLNAPLTAEVLNLIDESDATSPDRLFLAFMKTCTQGRLNGFLSLFTDAYIASEFGVADKNAFTSADMLDFQQFFNDVSVTNKTLLSYSCTVSGNVANVTATMVMHTRSRAINEDFEMIFMRTNGVWKIMQW